MNSTRTRDGWLLVEHPVTQPRARVLLLPGLLCTDLIFADMLDDPAMEQAGVQLVAGNPPGFKGQPASPGFDFRVETYAQMVEDLARLGSSVSTFLSIRMGKMWGRTSSRK